MHPIRSLFRSATWLALVATLSAGTPALADPGTHSFDESMKPILAGYLKIQERLAADSTEGIAGEAQTLAAQASSLDAGQVSGEHAAHYSEIPAKLHSAARGLSNAPDIRSAREAFRDLSRPMAMWATISRPPGINVVFCSMAGASWLQREGEVRNPYYGAAMLNCGEVVSGSDHSGDSMNVQHDQASHGGHHMGRGGHQHMKH